MLDLRIALSFAAEYPQGKADFLLLNGNLCSRNGVLSESRGRLHAAPIKNSGVPEQEIAAARVYARTMNLVIFSAGVAFRRRVPHLVLAFGFLAGFSSIRLLGEAPISNPGPAGTIRVLILSGQGRDDWRASTSFLETILAARGPFEVKVNETPRGLTPETLAPFDVLVDDYNGPRWGRTAEKAVEDFVRSGKGLVVTHGALTSFGNCEALPDQRPGAASRQFVWPAFAQMTKGHWSWVPADGLPGSSRFYDVRITMPGQPIVQGLKSEFSTADQIHPAQSFLPGVEVLATAQDNPRSGHNLKPEPVLFVSSYGRGRVFCTALGHDLAAMQEDAFVTCFLRGTEWAATGKVTLAPEWHLRQPERNAVRALLVTGGHEHESAFYSLFDGYRDVDWVPVDTTQMAFQKDLRKKYDVLILYDFSRDLDENGKRNLRDFVESGKGVVVLHHAILSYEKWPWWYQEVVGGRYLLDREGDRPMSRARGGEELFVTPEGTHPITAGIGPFHVWDEPYKDMWISPAVKPILTTDNPYSDHVIAWISPYPKSRVFFVQLGHGHTVFYHPKYRALVHNAILWAAGRTPP